MRDGVSGKTGLQGGHCTSGAIAALDKVVNDTALGPAQLPHYTTPQHKNNFSHSDEQRALLYN